MWKTQNYQFHITCIKNINTFYLQKDRKQNGENLKNNQFSFRKQPETREAIKPIN